MRLFVPLLAMVFVFNACASKKELASAQSAQQECRESLDQAKKDLAEAQAQLMDLQTQYNALRESSMSGDQDLAALRAENTSLRTQMESMKQTSFGMIDLLTSLDMLSQEGANSIKNTLETINASQANQFNQNLEQQGDVGKQLVANLKRSLAGNSDDVQIELVDGRVMVSVSEKLLFPSGSAEVRSEALPVLEKVARVINDNPDLQILILGHTDNLPIKTDCVKDNWDLSTLRATDVIRVMQWRFKVAPQRMVAGGRAQYQPLRPNDTNEGRRANRRTEIIITPTLDQFVQLLQPERPNK